MARWTCAMHPEPTGASSSSRKRISLGAPKASRIAALVWASGCSRTRWCSEASVAHSDCGRTGMVVRGENRSLALARWDASFAGERFRIRFCAHTVRARRGPLAELGEARSASLESAKQAILKPRLPFCGSCRVQQQCWQQQHQRRQQQNTEPRGAKKETQESAQIVRAAIQLDELWRWRNGSFAI